MASVPSLAELRALVERQGVKPTDADLEAVQAFLEVLLPAWEEVERLIPPGTVPAGLLTPGESE
jgi:hypothetical protein